MANLFSLPPELIEPILLSLRPADLASLLRTCRQGQRISEPFLYASITLTWAADKDHPPIAPLLHALIHRPDLASFVTSISLLGYKPRGHSKSLKVGRRNHDPPSNIWNSRNKGPSDEDKSAVTNFLKDLGFLSSGNWWLKNYLEGEVDVFVAIVLSQLKNLESLQLSSEFQSDTEFIGKMLHTLILSPNSPNRFTSLREVEYGSDVKSFNHTFNVALDPDQVWPLTHLPALVKFTAACFQYGPHMEVDIEPAESPLQSLHLSFCHFESAYLRKFISLSSAHLTTLEYHVAFDMAGTHGGLFFNSSVFVKALKKVAKTLKHLKVDVTIYSWAHSYGGSGLPETPQMMFGFSAHSLQFLTSLESLCIPLVSLFGWYCSPASSAPSMSELLPPTLRHLTLSDAGWRFEEYEWGDEEALMDRVSIYFEESKPRLESLTLKIPNIDEAWFEDAEMKLKEICGNSAVDCYVTRTGS